MVVDWLVPIGILAIIIYIGISVRISTLSAPTVLDYDPWWYYRHALEIMNNNFQPPKWDILSYYPPGRPYEPFLGWIYTMIFFYKAAQVFFASIPFVFIAKLSPVIMVALGAIPAFFLGRSLTNNIGGLATALFAILPPTYIGVSMAGYSDNDPVVVVYTFLSILSILVALKKKSLPFYILAILTNLLFAYNWNGGWFVSLLFVFFIPGLIMFRLFENFLHQRKLQIELTSIVTEFKSLIVPLLIVIIIANIIGTFTNLGNAFFSFLVSLGFINPEQGLLVNISVAELQRINILTRDGFLTVASRIGMAPTLFTVIGLPLLVIYKLYKKIKIEYHEIFLFLWTFATFYMILNGTRFSLQFSSAAAASAGYVIGSFQKYQKLSLVVLTLVLMLFYSVNQSYLAPMILVAVIASFAIFKRSSDSAVHLSTLFGITLIMIFLFITEAIAVGNASGGLQVGGNWLDALDWLKKNADRDALITTWWDPGHIISGSTGLKVHADGAHCGPGECVPYNHNIRIQDMGHVFSINNETEAIAVLQKYMQLTPEQCTAVKKQFAGRIPEDACKPVSEMYVIASSDLIGKYYWLSCFGLQGFNCNKNGKTGMQFAQIPYSSTGPQGNPIYGNAFTLAQKGDDILGIYNNRFIVTDMVYFLNGNMVRKHYENVTNPIDGMLWVDPGFGAVIFMEPQIRDSIFTKMFFFNGEGLQHFKLVYNNPEVKIFKVTF